jgi:DNA-binding response OmpR family regulator
MVLAGENACPVMGTGGMWCMSETVRLLLVEDDAKIGAALALALEREGFATTVAVDGGQGLELARGGVWDVMVLDWMLPNGSGLEILRALREDGLLTPVLLLTARDAVADRVAGLEAGADDYLTKPFALAELLARLRALLRRRVVAEPLRRYVGDLVVDFQTRVAVRGGRRLELTPREFDLLAYLICRAGQIVSREQLERDVWRETQRLTPLDNVIDVHTARLRRKLDGAVDGVDLPRLLHTVRGVGFVLKEGGL